MININYLIQNINNQSDILVHLVNCFIDLIKQEMKITPLIFLSSLLPASLPAQDQSPSGEDETQCMLLALTWMC